MTDTSLGEGAELSIQFELKTADRLEKAGRLDEAADIFERLLAHYPEHGETLRRYGRLAWDRQQPERAIELLQRAAEAEPPSQRALVDLAEIHHGLNRLDEAKAVLVKAFELNPKNRDLLVKLALIALAEGDRSTVYARCEEALEAKVPPVGAQQLIGTLFWEDGELEKAAKFLGAARQHIPPARDPNGLLASALFALGRTGEIEALPSCRSDGQLYVEVVLEALNGWQTERFEYCRHALMRARTLLPKVEDEVRHFAFSPIQRIITKLLDFGVQHQDLYAGEATEILFAIGDNHCLSMAHLPVRYQGQAYRIRPLHVVAGKAWHLAKPKANPQRSAVEAALNMVPRGAKVVLSFGDQDCRYRGGIQTHLKAHPELSPADVVDPLVTAYVERAIVLAAERDLEPIFLVPPAPNVKMRKIPSYERTLFLEIVDRFNDRLRAEARSRGCPVIDLFAATFDQESGIVGHHFFDGNHVYPTAVIEAFERLDAKAG